MTEVSGKTVGLFRKISEHTGVSVDEMFAGCSLDPHAESDPEYVAWVEFCVLCRNAREACGSNQRLAEMGVEVLELPALGMFTRIIQLFASAKTLYWANQRWTGPSAFTHLGNEFEELDNGLYRFTITIPDEHEDCPEFFHLNGGVLRVLPKLIGLPEAFVELDVSPRRCVYTIDTPPSITLWSRLRRAASILFGARTAIEALGEQQTLLARRYKELL
ncbi:MAG: hypothetical protein KDK70_34185, partial [Myxococcales bacterium]|nr:hypothetical protein [Myxococcales bacterium]